jgi:predicted glycosyltransferase
VSALRVWIDLANTPHVPLMIPIVARLREAGTEVLLTVREHAQTVELARKQWGELEVIGGESPDARLQKGLGIASRAGALARYARAHTPDVAFSHGSYAMVLGARAVRVPAVTMMDYEFQPANHLSFRLARRVIVPEAFLERELRRAGGRGRKVVRYPGFKEQLYLDGRQEDPAVLGELGVDPANVLVVMRPAPEGALYHRMENDRFDGLLELALARPDAQVVVLPRRAQQAERYRTQFPAAIVPRQAVDAASLLARADVMIGAGGTMTREAAVLGTPTYTVFAGRLAGVDAELIRRGLLHDLRDGSVVADFVKKVPAAGDSEHRSEPILRAVVDTLEQVAAR